VDVRLNGQIVNHAIKRVAGGAAATHPGKTSV
jgi:hypothetical protein